MGKPLKKNVLIYSGTILIAIFTKDDVTSLIELLKSPSGWACLEGTILTTVEHVSRFAEDLNTDRSGH